jgi:hypothetical protein
VEERFEPKTSKERMAKLAKNRAKDPKTIIGQTSKKMLDEKSEIANTKMLTERPYFAENAAHHTGNPVPRSGKGYFTEFSRMVKPEPVRYSSLAYPISVKRFPLKRRRR